MSLFFCISALRAIVEMLGLCLIAQALLYLMAGQGRSKNPIYRFFALLTRGPQHCVAACLPAKTPSTLIAGLTFLLLFCCWIGLAILRRFL